MTDLHAALALLFSELTKGPSTEAAYMLNPGDLGLLRSLDALTAEAASRPAWPGGATIAAHVDHLCYGLELMNRWAEGEEDPFSGADWAHSWRRVAVSADDWSDLRRRLRLNTAEWQAALQTPRELSPMGLNGMIASIAHLAYHLGAIRQIDRTIQGPKAT